MNRSKSVQFANIEENTASYLLVQCANLLMELDRIVKPAINLKHLKTLSFVQHVKTDSLVIIVASSIVKQ